MKALAAFISLLIVILASIGTVKVFSAIIKKLNGYFTKDNSNQNSNAAKCKSSSQLLHETAHYELMEYLQDKYDLVTRTKSCGNKVKLFLYFKKDEDDTMFYKQYRGNQKGNVVVSLRTDIKGEPSCYAIKIEDVEVYIASKCNKLPMDLFSKQRMQARQIKKDMPDHTNISKKELKRGDL